MSDNPPSTKRASAPEDSFPGAGCPILAGLVYARVGLGLHLPL